MVQKVYELKNSSVSKDEISSERELVGELDDLSERYTPKAGEKILKSVNFDRMSQVHTKLSEPDTRFSQNFRQGSHGR